MIDFYAEEARRYKNACDGLTKDQYPEVAEFINSDPTKISWSRATKNDLARFIERSFKPDGISKSLYRPFTKEWSYFDRGFNEMVYQVNKIFPNSAIKNKVICVSGVGARSGFSVLMSDIKTDFQTMDNGQNYPLKLFEEIAESTNVMSGGGLFDSTDLVIEDGYQVKDGITNEALNYFENFYKNDLKGSQIQKEDIFYYIYGILHSPEYRRRYFDNLTKELPRIPAVKGYEDFRSFSECGRKLGELHMNYENVDPYPISVEINGKSPDQLSDAEFRVIKMKFASKADKSCVIYNEKITLSNIPIEAYEYVINGRPALEWVMERQTITTHKDSGIVNDANTWAKETMDDAAYPLKLFQRVITVSLETMKIVDSLPKLDI
jgi:predicted helicase